MSGGRGHTAAVANEAANSNHGLPSATTTTDGKSGAMGSASNHSRVIAIDGPAAAGKTTVARALADRVGAIFLDTGLLYRAVTRAALDRGFSPVDGPGLTTLTNTIDLTVRPSSVQDGRAHDVLIDGVDVTGQLRSPDVDRHVSEVAAHAGVRAALLPIQRQVAQNGPVVMVGRDIATVVVPDAGLKIYLDASLEERARRRHTELRSKGVDLPFEHILAELERRDAADASRETSPLQQHADAISVPTDGLTIDEVVEELAALVRRTFPGAPFSGAERPT
jgi:cytidylate kinase